MHEDLPWEGRQQDGGRQNLISDVSLRVQDVTKDGDADDNPQFLHFDAVA